MVLHVSDLTVPMPPEALFGREGPFVLEVGFGDGWYLAHLAGEHPGWNLLGAELSLGSVARAYRRLLREGHTNARLYRGPARFLLRNITPRGSLHRIYVNFPDPWPKKKHRARRLLQAPFFRLASTRLEDGGTLRLTTDHPDYFQMALDEARATGLYEIETRPPPPPTLQTKYARKWRAQNKPIQHALFTKRTAADDPFDPVIDPSDAMHHAILSGTLPALEGFEKHVYPFDGGHVILLEALRPVAEAGCLFITRIEEPDLTQEVLIEVRANPKGYFVGIKSFCQPLNTRGTRKAVQAAAEWLTAHGMTLEERFF